MRPFNHSVYLCIFGICLAACGDGKSDSSKSSQPNSSRPAVTDVQPNRATGGDRVDLNGHDFGNVETAKGKITVGATTLEILTWTPNKVTVRVPNTLAAGKNEIVLQAFGEESPVDIVIVPTISGISTKSFGGVNQLTIAGSNFGSSSAGDLVTIGGVLALVQSWTNDSIIAHAPPDLSPGSAPVIVISRGEKSAPVATTISPSLSLVTPSEASVGDLVAITGANFGSAQGSVTVGGINAEPFSWFVAAVLFTVPPGMNPGVHSVVLTAGGIASTPGTLGIIPVLDTLSLDTGSGGTNLTITGSNFGSVQGSTVVSIGGAVASVLSWATGSITVTVPDSSLPGDQSLTVSADGYSSNALPFTVTPAATSLSPTSGATGSLVTLAGKNFGDVQGTVAVQGVGAVINSWSSTSIVFTVPAGFSPGTVGVVVTAGALPTTALTFTVTPKITGISANSGSSPESISITGTAFGWTQGSVTLGGKAATITSWSSTLVTIAIPSAAPAGAQNMMVITANSLNSNLFSLLVLPKITSLSPAVGGIGATLTILGVNFGAAQGTGDLVTVGGVLLGVSAWSSTSLTVMVPGNFPLGPKNVIVTAGGNTSNTVVFLVAPAITGISPPSGNPGVNVTLAGTTLGGTQGSVTVGGVPASISAWSDTSIGITIPLGFGPGAWNVIATTANGVTSTTAVFRVLPIASGISPLSGSPGDTITITGEYFGAISGAVTVGGVPAPISSWQSGTIVTRVPYAAPNGIQKVVVTAGGQPSVSIDFTVIILASMVASGSNHTCAVTTGGIAKCWGRNEYGQIGDGSIGIIRKTAVNVSGLNSGIAAISAGYGHTCALTIGGGVKCWGNNSDGQLGNGTTGINSAVPTDVSGLSSGITAIGTGYYHSCALTTSGGVKCWGDNDRDQIGNGGSYDVNTPAYVSGLSSGITAIAVGGFHTCALTSGGGVLCWGYNDYGQIGNGSTTKWIPTPVSVSFLSSGVTAIAAGTSHSCAITTGGWLYCWGFNDSGQLGDGTRYNRLTRSFVDGLAGVTAIRAGGSHTCAILSGGNAKCWGENWYGQIGDGAYYNYYTTPVGVSGLSSGTISISTGGSHTCALTGNGRIKCWGRNSYYQIGDGAEWWWPVPQPVSGLGTGGVAITAGGDHSCALTSGGAAGCWGYNPNGQVGDGTFLFDRFTWVGVSGLSGGVGSIDTGIEHTCAVTLGGAALCWGLNSSGQIGDGTINTRRFSPTSVVGLSSGTAAIQAGGSHTCAITTNGGVMCWGANGQGAIGDGTNVSPRLTPVNVSGLSSGVVAIAAGNWHTCALMGTGTVKCWGYNYYGQIGDGSTTDALTPVSVNGLTNIAAITAGSVHTCALTTGGSMKCWGANFSGEIGDGTSGINRLSPVAVSGLSSGVSNIGAGDGHTCAAMIGGGVKCWGENDYGEIGDGTQGVSRLFPVAVTGLTGGVTAIAAGNSHTCALTNAGSEMCWGSNYHGQLGLSYNNFTPRDVVGFGQ